MINNILLDYLLASSELFVKDTVNQLDFETKTRKKFQIRKRIIIECIYLIRFTHILPMIFYMVLETMSKVAGRNDIFRLLM